VFHQINQPAITDRRRVAGLRFGDDQVHALLGAVAINRLGLDGFNNRDLRALVAELLGVDPATITAGRMTYDLRRLRLHGLIERIPHTHRYLPTPVGWRSVWFYHHAYDRFLRSGLAEIADPACPAPLAKPSTTRPPDPD
jgi:hypothetical protein